MNSIEVHASMANGVPQSAHLSRTVTRMKKGPYFSYVSNARNLYGYYAG
jgi:hypothetical protein